MIDCICGICDLCKAAAPPPNKSNPPSVQEESPATRKKGGPAPLLNWAGGTRVFVLGTIDNKKQIDLYSGINGLHIRTLPGRRWSNPVLIGAGRQYLAVVDRFGDYDIIRVTDQYAGAGEEGFDDKDMPLPSVAWETIPDLYQVPTPHGTRCTGLMINQSGVLTAGISDGGPARYIKADLEGHIGNGTIDANGVAIHIEPLFEGEVPIEDFFKGILGTPVGNPASLEGHGGDTLTGVIGLSMGEGSSAVYHLDIVTGAISKLLGLPIGEEPLAIAHAAQIISILYADKILRFNAKDPSYLMSGVDSPESTPDPKNYEVVHTYTPQDNPLRPGASEAELRQYMDAANKLNAWRYVDVATSGETREILPASDSSTMNENRKQIKGTQTTAFYEKQNYEIAVSYINIPENSGLIFFESCFNTLTELYNKFKDGPDEIDTTQIIFRAVHASHYDYLSDGGFTYGCTKQEGGVGRYTNGLKGISLATDTDDTPGTLKPLRDLKAALVDKWTGYLIYRYPKPLGYRVYGGEYTTLVPEDSIQRSECTVEAEHIVEALDGIKRPEIEPSTEYPGLYMAEEEEYDCPWSLNLRHAQTNKDTATVYLKTESWSPSDSPEYAYSQKNPWSAPRTRTFGGVDVTVPPGNEYPEYISTSEGGFFALKGALAQTTLYAQALTEIANLESANRDYQGDIGGNSKSDIEKVQLQALIDINLTKIAQYNEVFAEPDDLAWNDVPGRYSDIGLSEACTEVDGVTPHIEVVPTPRSALYAYSPETRSVPVIDDQVVVLGEQQQDLAGNPKYRGCVIAPTIKSWISIEVDLESDTSEMPGISNYTNPEYTANGLGRNVGPANPFHSVNGRNDLGHSAGFVYEAGWRTRELANVIWHFRYDVGCLCPSPGCGPIFSTAYLIQVRNATIIDTLAPPNLRETLKNAMHASNTEVFYSPDTITSLLLDATMYNKAYNVYRYGYRTFQVGKGPGTPICAGADPGYYVGHNCEAIMCGNVQCNSYVFPLGKLYADDYVTPVVTTPILRIVDVKGIEHDPYLDKGILMGRYMAYSIQFTMNGNGIGIFGINITPSANK